MTDQQKIAPCLWFEREAEEAAELYVSVFPDSRITDRMVGPLDWPGGRAGDVIMVGFELIGQPYQALNGGAHDRFNDSVSLSVACRDQAEVDRYWEALTADGGAPVACGWLKDKFGMRWQIVPQAFFDMVRDDDRARATRVMQAMMGMVKLDVAGLKAAYDAA